MSSRSDGRPLAAGARPRIQPLIERAADLTKMARIEDGEKRVRAGVHSAATEGAESTEGDRRLGEREARVATEPRVPAKGRKLEPLRLFIQEQQADRQRLCERHAWQFGRCR